MREIVASIVAAICFMLCIVAIPLLTITIYTFFIGSMAPAWGLVILLMAASVAFLAARAVFRMTNGPKPKPPDPEIFS